MRRVLSAREQAEMLNPWLKTADEDLLAGPPPAVDADPRAGLGTPPPAGPQPPTMTAIPREDFDRILAPKGVTYDEHLDNLESHFDAATAEQQRRGRVWYRAGGDIIRDISQKFGMSVRRGIAMTAALSSRTDWNNNLHYFAHMAGKYLPGENEEEWKRANIHPSALARYMEERHGIVPGEKAEGDPTNPAHFSIKELKQLHREGYMPRTKADFNALAKAHGGNHWQYNPDEIEPQTGEKGRWTNAPLRGFEELQTREGRAAWLRNARMPVRGDTKRSPNKWSPTPRRKKGEPPPPVEYRKPWEDAIDGHMRQVRDSKSPYGFTPTGAYTGAGVPTLGGNIDKAKLLRTADEADFDRHLNGPKYRAFFANLGHRRRFRKATDPDDQGHYDLGGRHWTEQELELLRSTVDTQHMRAASQPHGSTKPVPGYSASSVVTDKQYEVYQHGLIDLTHRINSKLPQHRHLLPHQVQAIIWGKFKDDINAIKPSAGQTYWSPALDDIEPFGDRYSRRRLALATHIHPRLLEPPASDPYQTDSDEWFESALDSWFDNHHHELGGHHQREDGAVEPWDSHRPEVREAMRAVARADRLLAREVLAGAAEVLSYSSSLIRGGGIQDNTYPQEWMDKAEELARETGGFTIHDDPNDPDDAPSTSYQVAIPGHEDSTINTGEGWAEWARRNHDILRGHDMGTWKDEKDGLYYTEPSEGIDDYDEAARQVMERNQWSMWDNGAYREDPKTRKRTPLNQAEIPRTDLAQQGIANSTGFTLSKRKNR